VVDGGAPQVNAAAEVLAEFGITDITLCGLAKRLEEVWLPGEDFPLILPRTSEGLYLLQRVRDEAHRFAITFHRDRRSKRMTASRLDSIPGLGATRRKALLARFGSLRRLAEASPEEIASVPGVGPRTAAAIAAALNEDASQVTDVDDAPAVRDGAGPGPGDEVPPGSVGAGSDPDGDALPGSEGAGSDPGDHVDGEVARG
jgi:excinuclease ABC subunit C